MSKKTLDTYGKEYKESFGMSHKKKNGEIFMRRKAKMKEMVKRLAVAVTAVAVIFGSISAPATVDAKGTAFISKKVSKVTPTVKSAKRSKGKISVTVTVPKSKVKKLGKVKKITVAYSQTKNIKGGVFDYTYKSFTNTVKVTKKGKNQFKFSFYSPMLCKKGYLKVRFDGKSNWSKPVKVSGKATKPSVRGKYWVSCNSCGKAWYGDHLNELEALHSKHANDIDEAYFKKHVRPDGSYPEGTFENAPNHFGWSFGW